MRTPQTGLDTGRGYYLGSTSYASVFTEEHPFSRDVQEQSFEVSSNPPTSAARIRHRHCQIDLGHSVVTTLSRFTFFEKSVESYFETNSAPVIIGPLILSGLPQIRQDLEYLNAGGDDAQRFFADMTRNSQKPLQVPSTMLPSQFHTLFTGKNLRWYAQSSRLMGLTKKLTL